VHEKKVLSYIDIAREDGRHHRRSAARSSAVSSGAAAMSAPTLFTGANNVHAHRPGGDLRAGV
jgi:hypothetical protein